jgi:hypothetical protein
VSLDALGCVIQDFFGSIAALFCSTPHCSRSILYCISDYCISDRAGGTRDLAS